MHGVSRDPFEVVTQVSGAHGRHVLPAPLLSHLIWQIGLLDTCSSWGVCRADMLGLT
jgi:hypothetical protein